MPMAAEILQTAPIQIVMEGRVVTSDISLYFYFRR